MRRGRACRSSGRVSAIGEDGKGSAEYRRDDTVFMLQTGGHFTELCVRNAPRRKSRARLTARKSLEERLKLLADGGREWVDIQGLASAEEAMRASMVDLTGIS